MFCHKCGNQLAEGSAFCPKCGAKLAANDTAQQPGALPPVRQTQPPTHNVPNNTPKKKKSKKLPIMIGAIVLTFVVILIAANFDKLQERGEQAKKDEEYIASQRQLADTNPSGTYTDKTAHSAGFPLTASSEAINLFAEWAANHPSVGSYHLDLISDNDIDEKGNSIFLFTYEGNGGIFNMSIRKSDGYMEYISKFDTVSMDEWYNSTFGEEDRADNGTQNTIEKQILYKGIPVSSFFDTLAIDVSYAVGLPKGADRDDDIRLYIIPERGEVESAEVWNTSELTVDDISLNKNREGLIEILGEPSEEGGEEGSYSMTYNLPDCSMYFELGEPASETWRVLISPPN